MNGEISSIEFWIAAAFIPVLIATGMSDLRQMRIPNRLSWTGLAIFVLCFPLLGPEEWAFRSLAGLSALMVCFGLFAAGWLGGGDAKIFPVTILFIPLGHLAIYMFAFSAAMIVGMVGIWIARQFFSRPDSVWVSMQPGKAFPMGISIAMSLPFFLVAQHVLMQSL